MSMSPRGSGFPGRSWLAGLLLLGLGACRTSPPPTPPAVPPAMPDQQPDIPVDARQYRVVPEESLLQILVYRGGPMARLGHNHVIASHHLEGVVHFTEDVARTSFDIRLPVNELAVDEPAMREGAGPDFPRGVPQSARGQARALPFDEAVPRVDAKDRCSRSAGFGLVSLGGQHSTGRRCERDSALAEHGLRECRSSRGCRRLGRLRRRRGFRELRRELAEGAKRTLL